MSTHWVSTELVEEKRCNSADTLPVGFSKYRREVMVELLYELDPVVVEVTDSDRVFTAVL